MRGARIGCMAVVGVAVAVSAGAPLATAQEPYRVTSPDGRIVAEVLQRDGRVRYRIQRAGKNIVLPSQLGFEFRDAPPLRDSLRITGATRASRDTTWTQPWGEVARVRDRHNEMRVGIEETAAPRRQFAVTFRVFNDGVGFRYEFPEQAGMREFQIMDELTEFSMADDARAWSIPSNRARLDRSEMLYTAGPVSLLDSVQTPLTMEMRSGTFVVLHEANLVNYARMTLAGGRMENRTLRA
jgi:alpha-glucosidase